MLARALGHEVGNLLTAIRLSAHLLGAAHAPADRLELARSQQRLAAQAGALLALLRPVLSGATAVESLALPGLLTALARSVEPETPPGVTLRLARGRGLPPVRADADALHHALLSLVLAALEAAVPAGSVRLTASLEGRRVVLVLSDTGPPPEDARGAKPPRGRALLVALTDEALRACGGRVRAASTRSGARVTISLPVA
jgi:signal transduction histidine kinase